MFYPLSLRKFSGTALWPLIQLATLALLVTFGPTSIVRAQAEKAAETANQTQAAPQSETAKQSKAAADGHQSSTPSAQNNQEVANATSSTNGATTPQEGYRPLTGKERWQVYLKQNFTSPTPYLSILASAATDQGNNQPPEWKQGAEGFGKRLASRFGTSVIQGSIQASSAAALGLEPRYIRSTSKGFWRRSGHALASTFLTYNNEGKRRLNIPNLGSCYASSMIATTWYPDRYTALGDGVRDGHRLVLASGVFNLLQEFWPDVKRAFKGK